MRNEMFGRLLKAGIGSIVTVAGKTAPIIEEELGDEIGVAATTIQYYKTGNVPPEPRTIEILARACIQRGLLGREWLERFLREARYSTPDQLLDRLCPIGPARQRPPRIYENLPAPTYSQFITRAQAFAEVAEGLARRSAAVLLVGLGGNGKTSLAREVAAHCLAGEEGAPLFDAAVWVSDKDRPGTTNLSIVLDEIARTLDYPGFTQFEHEEKRREVEQLLRRQRALVVVDNFETITDGALLSWLLNLPEPSKALITTREYRREFRRGGWPVDLRGMTEDEARELIAERVRVLKIEQLVGNLSQLDPLLVATGGNPKAIEMTMGLIKYEHRPLQQVVEELYAARGNLFDDLFSRAWALLDEAARRVLLAAAFFPASASGEALGATADVHGFAFDHAVERLTDLALLDVQQEDVNSAPRFALHALVRAFAGARLKDVPAFEPEARERWVQWYVQLVASVGFCWDDLGKLSLLDDEQDTLHVVIKWAFQNRLYAQTLHICRDMRYYWDVRGLWDKLLEFEPIHVKVAQALKNQACEAEALAAIAEVFCRQNKLVEAKHYIFLLNNLKEATNLTNFALASSQQALFLYHRANQNFDAAQQVAEAFLAHKDQMLPYESIAGRHWLAACLYQQGDLAAARQILREGLSDAIRYNYQRSIAYYLRRLAMVDLDQGDLENAEQSLSEGLAKAREYQDRHYTGNIQRIYARLHTLRGDLPAARASLTEAIDLFERLGMRRELAEAREELERLEVTIASSEPALA